MKASTIIPRLFTVALGLAASLPAGAGGIHCRSCVQEPRCLPRPECTTSVVATRVLDHEYCARGDRHQKLEWSFKSPGTAYFSDSLAGAPNPSIDLYVAIKRDDNRFDVLAIEKDVEYGAKVAASFNYDPSLDLIVGGPDGEPSRTYDSSNCD